MPLVSIITPVLNAERYLDAAIESVRAQTFTDWELILVDDGSTDSSIAIAASAAKADRRIRATSWAKGVAHGAAGARNAGLDLASGEMIAFLDADDLYEPAKLEIETGLLAAHPGAAMVYGPTLWWRDGDQPWQWVEPMGREANRLHSPPTLLSKVILALDWHVPSICSVLVRRSAIATTGRFEEKFRLYEDQTLWVKLFLRYPVFVHDHCLARYRQHEHSVSACATRSGEYQRTGAHRSRAAFLDWLAQYIARSNISDARLARSLRLAQAPYGPKSIQRTLDLGYLRAKAQIHRARHIARRIYSALTGSGE